MKTTKSPVTPRWMKGETKRNEVCPCCGTRIEASRLRMRDLAVNALCGSLLLSILVPACWIAEQWMERQYLRDLDRMVWHEPLDSWNL
jgi:hypothetical protein